jgi:hypothetical protein
MGRSNIYCGHFKHAIWAKFWYEGFILKVVTERRGTWGEGVKVTSRFHERLAYNMKAECSTSVNLDYSCTADMHRPLGLREVDATRFPDNRQGCKPYAPAVFTPKYITSPHLLEVKLNYRTIGIHFPDSSSCPDWLWGPNSLLLTG